MNLCFENSFLRNYFSKQKRHKNTLTTTIAFFICGFVETVAEEIKAFFPMPKAINKLHHVKWMKPHAIHHLLH